MVENRQEMEKSDLKKMIGRLLCCWTALAGTVVSSQGSPPPPVPAVMQRNYDAARKNHEANTGDVRAAWILGRACFDRAEYSQSMAERGQLANEGIAASKIALEKAPELAEGHYYTAMNLAQLARTKLWGALPLLSRMEHEWLAAAAIDEKLDGGGPHRFVGLLYRDAPSWPVSLGDKAKARTHLLRAVELCPDFPENYLNLIESYLGWHEKAAAATACQKLQEVLPAARGKYAGEYWDESWKDWNQRLLKIQAICNPPPEAAHGSK
jgi:tetratricopeptide (TPR) repeat protein